MNVKVHTCFLFIGGILMEKYKILKNLIKFNTIKDKENKSINEYITEESYNKLVEQYKELIIKICK